MCCEIQSVNQGKQYEIQSLRRRPTLFYYRLVQTVSRGIMSTQYSNHIIRLFYLSINIYINWVIPLTMAASSNILPTSSPLSTAIGSSIFQASSPPHQTSDGQDDDDAMDTSLDGTIDTSLGTDGYEDVDEDEDSDTLDPSTDDDSESTPTRPGRFP